MLPITTEVRGIALQHAGLAADGKVRRQHQVGGADRDADDVEIGFLGRDLHMGDDRAVLLRQAGEVQGLDRLALQMRGHRQDGAGGDDAAAADAGEQAAPDRLRMAVPGSATRRRVRSHAPATACRRRARRAARPG